MPKLLPGRRGGGEEWWHKPSHRHVDRKTPLESALTFADRVREVKNLWANALRVRNIFQFRVFLPELSVGMATEGIEVRSVGNTLTLHETALIEAFNLKAAIEYQLKNCT